MPFKIHTVFGIQENATGGGNQFLKALRKGLRSQGVYAEQPDGADIFIFNSYQFIYQSLQLKRKYKDALFVHRIDGPIRLYNSMSDFRDTVTNTANHILADATIFQSEWSRDQNCRLGLLPAAYEIVIPNAPDPIIFNTHGKKSFVEPGKVRLVATSWSCNWNKGFKTYQWLDENLDFSRYEMTFVGNSPIEFNNIRHIPPMESKNLADQLRRHDIFIFASEFEACSNTLLEAMHCGLPVVAKNATSNPSVLNGGGELFGKPDEIPDLLDRIAANYTDYRQRIQVLPFAEVVERYYSFFYDIWEAKKAGFYTHRSLTYFSQVRLLATLKWWHIRDRIIGRLSSVC